MHLCTPTVVTANTHLGRNRSVLVIVSQVSFDLKISHVDRPYRPEKHIAKDAAEAPLVLIFKVVTVTKLVYFHCQEIVTGPEISGNVEFSRTSKASVPWPAITLGSSNGLM